MAQKLFERRYMGNVPDSMFKKLTQNYDIEQANINQIIEKMQYAYGNGKRCYRHFRMAEAVHEH